jgi:hypothetical protein
MNGRIKELAKQAHFDEDGGHLMVHGVYVTTRLEKFAELIVQECIHTIIDNTPAPNPEFDTVWELGYNRAMKDCVHHIAEHFDGVEE